MTRQPYRVRLALGRSAYDPATESSADRSASDTDLDTSRQYVQQYDYRGNPTNSLANSLQERQVQAKNDVLEAVGVCERRASSSQVASEQPNCVKFSADEWDTIASLESETASDIYSVTDVVYTLSTWWTKTLRMRILAGVVNPNATFTSLVLDDLAQARSHGAMGALNVFFAGLLSDCTFNVALTCALRTLQACVEAFEDRFATLSFKARSRHSSMLRLSLRLVENLVVFYISPIAIYSIVGQLHLDSQLSSWTMFQRLLPWHQTSPFHWKWSSVEAQTTLSGKLQVSFCSPPVLYFLSSTLWDATDDDGRFFTSRGEGRGLHSPYTDVSLNQETPSKMLRPLLHLRDHFLNLTGWSRHDVAYEAGNENDEAEADQYSRTAIPACITRALCRDRPAYRSTGLSRLPSQLLGQFLSSMCRTIAFLPVEMALVRSVAYFCRSSESAVSLRPTIWPLRGNWGSTLGKAGLCIAFNAAFDAFTFGCVWFTTRKVGISRYHWGVT